jgi:hypothetical protein
MEAAHHDLEVMTRNVPKPTQPKFMSRHDDVQRVEDKAWSASRRVGDFSKNRRRGHSMPPRSRKLKK